MGHGTWKLHDLGRLTQVLRPQFLPKHGRMIPGSQNHAVHSTRSFISCWSPVLRVQTSPSIQVRLKRKVIRGKGASKDEFTGKPPSS